MRRRTLEDLNLIDDFLFEAMVCHPEFGEQFCRILLSILMQREVGQIKIVPQKVYPGSDTDRHGSRLDVYVEEFFNGDINMDVGGLPVIYDIEPEKGDKTKSSLPRRVRFYHSSIGYYSRVNRKPLKALLFAERFSYALDIVISCSNNHYYT